MTSMPTTETADPVLVGRSAFVFAGQQFTWITGVERDAVRTAAQPDRLYAPEEVVVLPMLGEFVETRTEDGPVTGWWLGDGVPKVEGDRLNALVLRGQEVRRVTLEPSLADCRRVVSSRAGEAERAVMVALLAEARQHEHALRRHTRWTEAFVADAHETAAANDLCEVADALLERHGLPARSRDFDLRVEVSATLYVSREGRDLSEAVSRVSAEEMLKMLQVSDLSLEIEEDD